ncbi:MAG: DUF2202 domain-containing protein [Spirochaetaceae bacterium]|nr:MAG: DUF2202 domain-containing protein [Spirochaetaceae bacterium]
MKNTVFAGILAATIVAIFPSIAGAQTTVLTEAEKAGIILMREEEKLARDVYLELYYTWKIPVFANIAASEQTHMDAMKNLIAQFGLADPVKSDELGAFTSRELAGLYKELITFGNTSAESAVIVGARIEELDIADLMRLIGGTKNTSIISVYENLLKGSRNHLRSFSGQFARYGTVFKPEYISPELYQQIIRSPREQGPYAN